MSKIKMEVISEAGGSLEDAIASERLEDIQHVVNQINKYQQLHLQNKININNVWQINIIQYLKHYVSSDLMEANMLQSVSISLAICVQVFGYRVEYIAAELNKLLNCLNQAGRRTSRSTSVGASTSSSQADLNGNKAVNQRKCKKRRKSTISEDSSNIFLNDIPKKVSVDFTGNHDVYADNYKNMFIHQIPMDHSIYKFQLKNRIDPGFLSYDTAVPEVNKRACTINVGNIDKISINPEFTFNFDEDNSGDSTSACNRDNILHDENGAPTPELYECDSFADAVSNSNRDGNTDDTNESIHLGKRKEMITSFCPTDLPLNSSLSELYLQTEWIGPSHWKNKHLKSSAPKYSVKRTSQTTRRGTKRKRSSEKIDFSQDLEISFKRKCRGKARPYDLAKVTLPPPYLSQEDDFENLILRNCSHTENFDQNELDMATESGDNGENNVPVEINSLDISTPRESISQMSLPYATKAKQVNLKKLKGILHESLKKDSEGHGNTQHKLEIKPTLFSSLCKAIKKLKEEIGVPVTYFALLHLANDEGLQLEACDTYDARISKWHGF